MVCHLYVTISSWLRFFFVGISLGGESEVFTWIVSSGQLWYHSHVQCFLCWDAEVAVPGCQGRQVGGSALIPSSKVLWLCSVQPSNSSVLVEESLHGLCGWLMGLKERGRQNQHGLLARSKGYGVNPDRQGICSLREVSLRSTEFLKRL